MPPVIVVTSSLLCSPQAQKCIGEGEKWLSGSTEAFQFLIKKLHNSPLAGELGFGA